MLVISRKLGEAVYIGENIKIVVVDIDRGKIRLGLEVPRDIPIYRQEVTPFGAVTADSPNRGELVPLVPAPGASCPICGNASCTEPGGKH